MQSKSKVWVSNISDLVIQKLRKVILEDQLELETSAELDNLVNIYEDE